MAESKGSGELPSTVKPSELARLLGVSTRRLQQLANEDVVHRAAHGRYVLVSSVQGFLAQKSETPKGQSNRSAADEIRMRREALKLEEIERKLVPLAEAIGVLDILVGEFRSAVQALPARLARDKGERGRMESEVDGLLDSLAARFRELGIALEAGREPDEADAEDEPGGVGEEQ